MRPPALRSPASKPALVAALLAAALWPAALARGPDSGGAVQAADPDLPQYDAIDDPREAAQLRRDLQKGLRGVGIGEPIRSCPVMVDVRHNARVKVHGAICEIGRGPSPRLLLMCDEHGIGQFALATTFGVDADSAHLFARRACAEGPWEQPEDPGPVGNTIF